MPDRNQSAEPIVEPREFPVAHAHVLLRGPAGALEALIDVPEEDPMPCTAVILGPAADQGTMHSKVAHIVERSLRELGAATVRFNFRGVGASDGEPDHGIGETEDLLAVVNWVRETRPDTNLWLGGYGFGAYVAIRGCQKLPVAQLVTVAPPVDHFDFSSLPVPTCPWLIIQGDTDDHVSPDAVYAWAEALDPAPQLVRMEDADHSFHRRLMDLRGAIKNGIRRQLRSAETDQE